MTLVYGFGYSLHGQLGIPRSSRATYPQVISSLRGISIRAVTCGAAYTSVISSEGDVFSFGDMRGFEPHKELVFHNIKIKKMCSTAMFDLVLTHKGEICLWGKISPNQNDFALPQRLEVIRSGYSLWGTKFADISAGALHALAISCNGELYAFGSNEHGQLGIPTLKNQFEKLQLVSFFSDKKLKVTSVACGGNHSLVLTENGEIWTFGSNKYGQLGLGNEIDRDIPISISSQFPHFKKVTKIACGDYHSLVVNEGKLHSFGLNKNGQLGLGHFRNCNKPHLVTSLSKYDIVSIAAGGGYGCSHTLVLVSVGLGILYSFGSGGSGQLGYPVPDSGNQPEPQVVKAFEKEIILDIACGWLHSIVVIENRNLQDAPKSVFPFSFFQSELPKLGAFTVLPTDIYRLILENLDAVSLSKLSCVCKFFMLAANDNSLWEALVKKRFNYLSKRNENTHWKVVYALEHSKSISPKRPPYPGLFDSFFTGLKTLFKASWALKGRVLMLGLDAAGKTTILYKMRISEVETTIPTIGFNVETATGKNFNITCWDIGGPDKIRPLWRHYWRDASSLIFVVDSNDRDRIGEAGIELQKNLNEDELRNIPLLVFANKQDLPNAMSVSEIVEHLGLNSIRNRKWFIQASCACSGDGLYEGFQWLVDNL